MKKKLVAMIVTTTMCAVFAVQNVEAASCPPHNNTTTYAAPVSHWTTGHRVYRNLFVDGKQVYSWCTVSCEAVRFTLYCTDCGKRLHEEDEVYESHSLAGDLNPK